MNDLIFDTMTHEQRQWFYSEMNGVFEDFKQSHISFIEREVERLEKERKDYEEDESWDSMKEWDEGFLTANQEQIAHYKELLVKLKEL